MSELRTNPSLFRQVVAMVWAVVLAGCIPQPVTPPGGAPSNLVATPSDGAVSLSWSASSGATGYSVKRATTHGGPYTRLAAPASASYTDSAVINGTAYYYVVSAFNKGGETADSTEASAIPAIPSIPLAPTNVTTTSGNGSAVISWSASAGATSYRVKRSATSGGPYVQVGAPASTTYTDTPLTNGVTYYYVVSAVNSLGESPNSTQVNATPSPPPPTTFGTWVNVTPAGVDLSNAVTCGNPYTNSVVSDPNHAGTLYTQFSCQGIWKSVDYGISWTGPINTGVNGSAAASCEGGIVLAPNGATNPPIIYEACIRGGATGFWRSVDGGVSWATNTILSSAARQDYFTPVVDPYDHNHLLMTAHEFDSIVESTDGGASWTQITENNGMLLTSQNSAIFFVNTGSASTTRGTWLWIAGGGGGGTWRTTNGGTAWTRVDSNEAYVGIAQIYQPDNSGIVFMAGANSTLGAGILRSTDYGATWSHVGNLVNESTVFGSSKNLYAMSGTADKSFSVASQPGTGQWVFPGTPANLVIGAARVAVVNDGTNNILVGAMWQAGLWRYVEP